MVPYETFTFLLWVFASVTVAATNKHDFRYISYQDLQQSLDKFSQHETVSYSQMLFDVARNQVLVGARDILYRLSLSKLELLEYAKWPAPKDKRTQCLDKGQMDEFCHNYVRILLTNGKYLFACGTNAFSPQCSYRKIENISEVTEWVDGVAKCPYNPGANITGFMSETGDYYFGGPTDFSGSDSLIAKNTNTEEATIRTKQYNSLWLNEPQFVGSFETENFVYFLFREAAVEYINCGKTVYSRIARVCKNDSGGHTMLKDNWTTFIKARLNCSISGEYPFYFDEVQSMSYVPDENIVYATFTTPTNSIAGSAICAFNLTAIERAFAGPFKYQEHMGSAWGKHNVQHRDHFECKSSWTQSGGRLVEISKYQLMDNAVQATTLSPLHVAELERFTHITIDVLSTKLHTSVHVIYVATTAGVIKKISILPRTQEACTVEIWQSDSAGPVRGMQFLKETNSVYITTDTALLKIPADHCGRHKSKESCANAMDPYCGWNERFETCSAAPNSNPLDKYWKQSVTSCPVLDAIVDGGWSSWSNWAPCEHRGSLDVDSSDNCLCQTRECNNPTPSNGGLSCAGNSIAVMNCTVHGDWSDWSAWSSCSATCGTAVKTRSRTCTNPAPAHSGRVCVGQDRAVAFCAEIPPCPAFPQDGGWSKWSDWGSCSAHCGGGYRKRFRRCDDPPAKNGGQFCVGNDVEIEHCNVHECTEHKKQMWSDWISDSNATTSEHHKKRFRFICKATVKHAAQIKVGVKEEICNDNGCFLEENDHPRWGAWSGWSECSATCGGGQQTRTRYCEGRNCQGSSTQNRDCNKHQCQEWGCWSEWSPCNVSCGWGVKTRYRSCLGNNCKGADREEQPCENTPCDSLLGWGNWTSWSICDSNREQHRKRKCRTLNPGPNICQGSSEETRMCISDSYDDANAMKEGAGNTVLASTPAVVSSLITGLLIGLFVGAISMHFYIKKKKTKIPSSPHYMSPKQNPYISMPLQERPQKKNSASTSNNILNNVQNGTLKSVKYDYDTATIKRNSHGLNNGHTKQDLLNDDDKYYYD